MKILKNSLLIAFTILFISCTSDDSTPIDTNAQANDLLGTWKLTEITQEGTTKTEIQGVPITANFSSVGKNINSQLVFTDNPNNFTSSGSYTSVVTITIVGQSTSQEIPVDINDYLNQGTWEFNAGIITVNSNGEIQTANITELTNTTLKFEVELDVVTVDQGITNRTNTTAKMTLIK